MVTGNTKHDIKMAWIVILYSCFILVLFGFLLLGAWPADTADLELNATSTFNHTQPAFNAINDINSTRPISVPFFGISFFVGPETLLVCIMIFAGAMGAAIFSLWAAAKHLSYKRNFNYERYKFWYITRPFLGSGLALFFYFLIRGGLLTIGTEITMMNIVVIAGLSGLVGMFSEQAILKLSEVADATFGSKKAEPDEPEEVKIQAIEAVDKASNLKKEAEAAVKEADEKEAKDNKKSTDQTKKEAMEAREKADESEEKYKKAQSDADELLAKAKKLIEEAKASEKDKK